MADVAIGASSKWRHFTYDPTQIDPTTGIPALIDPSTISCYVYGPSGDLAFVANNNLNPLSFSKVKIGVTDINIPAGTFMRTTTPVDTYTIYTLDMMTDGSSVPEAVSVTVA